MTCCVCVCVCVFVNNGVEFIRSTRMHFTASEFFTGLQAEIWRSRKWFLYFLSKYESKPKKRSGTSNQHLIFLFFATIQPEYVSILYFLCICWLKVVFSHFFKSDVGSRALFWKSKNTVLFQRRKSTFYIQNQNFDF